MRVCGRLLVLAGLFCFVPVATANAAPLLPVGGANCSAVLGRVNDNCSLYSLGVLDGTSTQTIEFESDADVALFRFSVAVASTFAALTSSTGLDSMLALFDGDTRVLYSYFDDAQQADVQAFGADIDPFADTPDYNDQLAGVSLAAGTSYYLAVLLNADGQNGFGFGAVTSLGGVFGCELLACAGEGGTFALQVEALPANGPAPVPEPGTLALIGSGALAALARSRARKRA